MFATCKGIKTVCVGIICHDIEVETNVSVDVEVKTDTHWNVPNDFSATDTFAFIAISIVITVFNLFASDGSSCLILHLAETDVWCQTEYSVRIVTSDKAYEVDS